MKLRVGKCLIETDYIELVEQLSTHNVKLFFASGKVLEVVCGVKTTSPATWDKEAEAFIETLQNTDVPKIDAAVSKKKR